MEVSIVFCTGSPDRFDDFAEATDSLLTQMYNVTELPTSDVVAFIDEENCVEVLVAEYAKRDATADGKPTSMCRRPGRLPFRKSTAGSSARHTTSSPMDLPLEVLSLRRPLVEEVHNQFTN